MPVSSLDRVLERCLARRMITVHSRHGHGLTKPRRTRSRLYSWCLEGLELPERRTAAVTALPCRPTPTGSSAIFLEAPRRPPGRVRPPPWTRPSGPLSGCAVPRTPLTPAALVACACRATTGHGRTPGKATAARSTGRRHCLPPLGAALCLPPPARAPAAVLDANLWPSERLRCCPG
jgi:hypothetical protein